jgi:putative transposase
VRPPGPACGRGDKRNLVNGFVSDALFDGRRIRALTVVDDYSRESLAIEVGQSITGEQVVTVMNRLSAVRGAPKRIRVDNGPEFVSRAFDQWAYLHQVTLDFSRPGKPTDNALVESFNGRLRDQCLNTNWFLSLDDAKRKIEAWRQHYNESRPHTSLGFVPPSVFCSARRRERRHINPDYSLARWVRNRGTLIARLATFYGWAGDWSRSN